MAPRSMNDTDRLLRSLNRNIRNLEGEVDYLRRMLFDATHEPMDDCDDPTHDHGIEIPVQLVPEERRGEPLGITGGEDLVRQMLTD